MPIDQLIIKCAHIVIFIKFVYRLGSGKPANVIVDDGKNSEDEDETFVVEETAPPPTEHEVS